MTTTLAVKALVKRVTILDHPVTHYKIITMAECFVVHIESTVLDMFSD